MIRLAVIAVAPVLLAGLSVSCVRADKMTSAHASASADEEDVADHHEHRAAETVESMTSRHAHLGPHFRWTALRPANTADRQRAEEIVRALREALAPYRDYRVAIRAGYEPFLPHVQQPHYHFTSKWRGFKGAFRFNPAEPTSLLYKRSSDGYELEGAIYTAPKGMSEDRLNERVPLSVAQWHAHVNICLPPKRQARQADWTKFGPKGSIVTEAECDRAGGRFYPQLFGWMIHVYPFEERPEKIGAH